MSVLIGLAGKARSGKDTAARFIMEHCSLFEQAAFAGPIKEGCRAMFGLNDAHLYGDLKETVIEQYGCSPRQIMQWCGTEFGRSLVHPEIWVMQVRNEWEACRILGTNLVVTDVRFDNEAMAIREMGGVVVHVTRPSHTSGVTEHASEQGVTVLPEDEAIVNDCSLHHLRRRSVEAVRRIQARG